MERISPELKAAPLLDARGSSSPLGATWAERPAVLIFLRHFG